MYLYFTCFPLKKKTHLFQALCYVLVLCCYFFWNKTFSPRDRRKLIRLKKLRKLKGSGTQKLQDSQKSSSRFKSHTKIPGKESFFFRAVCKVYSKLQMDVRFCSWLSTHVGAGLSVSQLPLHHQHSNSLAHYAGLSQNCFFSLTCMPPPRVSRHFFKPSKENTKHPAAENKTVSWKTACTKLEHSKLYSWTRYENGFEDVQLKAVIGNIRETQVLAGPISVLMGFFLRLRNE